MGIPRLAILLLLLALLAVPGRPAAAVSLHHDLTVTITPEKHHLAVRDTIEIESGVAEPADGGTVFFLHTGLSPTSPTPGVRLTRLADGPADAASYVERYLVESPRGLASFVVLYEGEIDHPLVSRTEEEARNFMGTSGTIGPEGVFLSGGSFWYPRWQDEAVTFALTVTLPEGWRAVSQGKGGDGRAGNDRKTVERWESGQPQEEIFLVANRFTAYGRTDGDLQALVFLRQPDPPLAERYLAATLDYVAMYDRLLGPYPYAKFALVENFWESGYGMPSFTLLGSRVLRFPFILTSSYPHEILHNWWGNSVYPDYESGNWSEGLTAYLADHLFKELEGEGVEYRRATLQKYGDYVSTQGDFPLDRFVSRHSSSSEAVGYGKSMMFFHMLRRQLGDDLLARGLRRFYTDFQFKTAAFSDIRASFEKEAALSLQGEFEQWVHRAGAPQLTVGQPRLERDGEDYILTVILEQTQPEEVYRLRVPLAVTLAGRDRLFWTETIMTEKRREVRLQLPARPLRLDVDPEFDLFRRLHRDETPPALTGILGSRDLLILLPAAAEPALLEAYGQLARSLARSGPEAVEIALDSDLAAPPANRDVVLLGWENRFAFAMSEPLSRYEATIGPDKVRLRDAEIDRQNHAVLLTGRRPDHPDHAIAWIGADRLAALPGLARKLPHYQKYSYLTFEGDEPVNVSKGRWPVIASPLTVFIPDEAGKVAPVPMATPPPREPLARPGAK